MPEYIHAFLYSCSFNKNFDFYLFTDWNIESLLKTDNIFYIKSNLKHFKDLCNQKIPNLDINILFPYKLCDLKPAWPHIFEDYFQGYDYVGYCDIDLIFGDISKFFNDDIIKAYDIFTITPTYISGALTIFRNKCRIKRLYQSAYGWKYIFQDPRHWAFDEFLRIDDFKKEKDCKNHNLESFSDCVYRQKGDISVTNQYIAYEKRPSLLYYDKGQVIAEDKEWICFHYVVAKHTVFWIEPNWKQFEEQFYVNKYTFFKNLNKEPKPLRLVFNLHYMKGVCIKSSKKFKTVKKLILNLDFKNIKEAICAQFR